METRKAATDPDLRRQAADQLWVDVSQSAARCPWRVGANLPVVTRTSTWYSYAADTVVGPEQALAAYGRQFSPDVWASLHAAKQAREMVGNVMAAQPLAAILHAIIYSGCIDLLEGAA